MQLPTTTDQLTINNTGSINEFKIRASAKSFAILSNSLYQNKIRAIIRELSCNALDSHRAANNPDKFNVHLPTMLDPQFSIRDFGMGLSHDQVMSLYTTYFESTKTNSNDFIGALGLGSKSPFSYTNAFTVTTYQNGWCGSYAAFIDDRGIPSITQLNQDSTDQPNGVEIQFAVKSSDFDRFYTEAEYVFQWWNTTDIPTIQVNGGPSKFNSFDDLSVPTPVDGVYAVRSNSDNIAFARMGNIGYPIDTSIIDDPKLRALLQQRGLVIDFDIGELDFQPSREGLSYIDFTRTAIVKRVQAIYDQLYQHACEQVDSVSGTWEKHGAIRQLMNDRVIDHMYRPICNQLLREQSHSYLRSSDRWDRLPMTVTLDIPISHVGTNVQLTSGLRSEVGTNGSLSVIPSSTDRLYQFIVVPDSTKVASVMRRMKLTFPANHGYHRVFCLSPIDQSKPMDTERWFKEVAMGVPSDMIVGSVDELTRPPTRPRKSTSTQPKLIGVHTVDVMTFYGSSRRAISLDDTTQVKYYVTAKDRRWIPKHPKLLHVSPQLLTKLGKFVREYTNKHLPEVYMLSERRVSQISRNQTWQPFEQMVVDVIEQVKGKVDHRWVRDQYPYRADRWLRMINAIVNHRQCDTNTSTRWSSLKELANVTNSMHDELAMIDQELYEKIIARIEQQEQLTKQFAVKYPMLQHIDSFTDPSVMQDILAYINLVNSTQTKE